MAYDIRTKYYLEQHGIASNVAYIKELYVKNKYWNPPPASISIEDKLTQFEKLLKQSYNKLQENLKGKNLSNLTKLQSKALYSLKNDKETIIKPTDKNLGPAVLDLDKYIKQILLEHLLTNDYKQLTKEKALQKMDNIKIALKNMIANNHGLLTKAELIYFQRSFQLQHRLPVFYGLPKVHKDPVSLRPVVSNTNSFLAIFSVWLDHKMKSLLPLIRSYVKNSTTIIQELKELTLPEGAKIFSADATSMYTNIDVNLGIATIEDFLQSNEKDLPPQFPSRLFLDILREVMCNNIFTFGETYWLQLQGTAMGTPSACAYATLTYGHYENTSIIPIFRNQLLYYRRYIDDVLGIWIPQEESPGLTWTDFKNRLNNWGVLKWTIEEPSTHTTFLDLNIDINGSSITFSTFQKPLNLYLYLPPLSAHPPGCLKGLIIGELKRYWLQNTTENFEDLVSKFLKRLVARGHPIEKLSPIFNQAALILDGTSKRNSDSTNNDRTIFIHWTHHPNGLKSNQIKGIYNQTLQPQLNYDKTIVAVSRPQNLKDALTRAALTLQNGKTVQSFIDNSI